MEGYRIFECVIDRFTVILESSGHGVRCLMSEELDFSISCALHPQLRMRIAGAVGRIHTSLPS